MSQKYGKNNYSLSSFSLSPAPARVRYSGHSRVCVRAGRKKKVIPRFGACDSGSPTSASDYANGGWPLQPMAESLASRPPVNGGSPSLRTKNKRSGVMRRPTPSQPDEE